MGVAGMSLHPAMAGQADWASPDGGGGTGGRGHTEPEGRGMGAMGRGPRFPGVLIPVPWQGQRRGARGRRQG